jgi:tRNA(Ser,Leu) C12 N-acetylase TAN1
MTGHNVVVSVHDRGYKRARELLEPYGHIHKTDYYNVLAMTVDDTGAFLERLGKLTEVVPEVLEVISRAVPAQTSFEFQSAEAFETQAREAALARAPELAGKSFHVRLHRRGFKGRLSSHDEERFLDEALLEALEAAGTPGHIAFEDPDAVIDVETLGNWAGLSLWTREDLVRYPFLKVD